MISPAPKSVFGLCRALAIRVSLHQAVPAILLALHFLTLGLHGQEFIVPASMATNDVAFGSGTLRAGNYRAQEVYAASAFSTSSGPKLVRELRWRPDYFYGNAFTSTVPNLEIRLSTTQRVPEALSTVFADNPGADERLVFSGSITLSSRFLGPPNGPKDFDIVVPLQTPFFYDPAYGNLLVDIRNYTNSNVSLLAGQGVNGDGASRNAGPLSAPSAGAGNGADVIKFICEPATNITGIIVFVQPSSLSREIGGSASFVANAVGEGPFQYQWRHNGIPLPGRTNATLLLMNLQPEQAGTYEIVVSNPQGFATNATAQLQIPSEPGVVLPASLLNNDVAFGSGTLRNGNSRIQQVYGAAGFMGSPGPKGIRELRWRPDFVHGNAFTSSVPQLEIRLSTTQKQPEALSQMFSQNTGPDERIVYSGPITLSSRFTGPANGPKDFDIAVPLQSIFFYEPTNGNLLVDIRVGLDSGASLLAGQGVNGDGASRMTGLLFDAYGGGSSGADAIQFIYYHTTNSTSFVPNVEPPGLWREVGQNARFDAYAVGQGPFQYSWRHNGNPLSGQTNASLLLTDLQLQHSGTYEMVASNLAGFVTNDTAELYVSAPTPGLMVPAPYVTNNGTFTSGTFSASNSRVQQVYGATAFSSGPKLIREFRWRPDPTHGMAFTSQLAQLEIRLSTTPRTSTGLSPFFVENTGADQFLAFSGPVMLSSRFLGPLFGPKEFDIVVPLQNYCLYDPAEGNLLVDILHYGGSGASLLSGQSVFIDEVARVSGAANDISGSVGTGADVIKIVSGVPTNWSGIVAFVRPAFLARHMGESAQFKATAFGDGPFQYQWRYNGTLLLGQTNTLLSLVNLQPGQEGAYEVVVSNSAGFVTNAIAQLQVTAEPSVVLPASLRTNDAAFGSGTLRIAPYSIQQVYAATGFASVPGPRLIKELRWRPDYAYGTAFSSTVAQVEIRLSTTQRQPEALSANFAANTGPDEQLVYSGPLTITSAFAGPPNGPKDFDIIIPLQTPFFYAPERGNLLVYVRNFTASRASPVAGQSIGGDGASRNTGLTDGGADVIKFVFKTITNVMGLSVYLAPPSQEHLAGGSAQFEAFAYGGEPFDYRWKRNGDWLPGQTNSILLLTNVQPVDSGSYEVVVSNMLGAVNTSTAQLSVTNPAPPTIVRGPYLQCVTTSNAVVRWRTHVEEPASVRFGLSRDSQPWEHTHGMVTGEHSVTLTNLAPGTKYYYSIWAGTNLLDGSTNSYLKTAPVSRIPTRIWAIGDAGTMTRGTTNSLAVRNAYLQHSQGRHTDVWLMLGDNAYNSGTDQEYQIAVFNIYPTLLPNSPVWPTVGNHDAESMAMLNIFSLPTQGEAGGVPSGSELYYSFNHGNIHFVCLDSEVTGKSPGDPQLLWLEQDLAANTNDWVIAYWHSPPYSRGSHHSDYEQNLVQMREWVVPILENYGVDLVLCGHSHSYERSYLLDGHYGSSATLTPSMIKDGGSGRTNDTGAYRKPSTGPAGRQGAVYVVAGSSGQTSGVSSHPAMFVYLNRLGSMVIDIDGDRLDARFLRETGAVDDHFTILKGAAPEPLHIATFRSTGGTVTARWKSVAGYIYRIECSPSLEPAQWNTVANNITATGATTTWSGPANSPTGEAYYRVVQISP